MASSPRIAVSTCDPRFGGAMRKCCTGLRVLFIGVLAAVGLSGVGVSAANADAPAPVSEVAETVLVSTSEDLMAALASARGGEIISLAPGAYGRLSLRAPLAAFDKPVTLRSARPDAPATFEKIQLRGVRNLGLEGLAFRYQPRKDDGKLAAMLDIRGDADGPARGITVRACSFAGTRVPDGIGADPLDAKAVAAANGLVSGAYAGRALYVRDAEDLRVTGNRATAVYRGFGFERVARLEVDRNLLQDIRSDGMTFGELQDARIERNVVRELHPWRHEEAPGRGDHPDLIQFWTTNSNAPTRDVIIRKNMLIQQAAADDSFAQGLFMRNPKAEADAERQSFFYRDITIEDNVIYNGHINSLVVGETLGLSVARNLLIADPEAGEGRLHTPILSIAARSENVTVMDNTLPELSAAYSTIDGYVSLERGQALGWRVEGNRYTRLDRSAGVVFDEEGAELYSSDTVIEQIDAAIIRILRGCIGDNEPNPTAVTAGCL